MKTLNIIVDADFIVEVFNVNSKGRVFYVKADTEYITLIHSLWNMTTLKEKCEAILGYFYYDEFPINVRKTAKEILDQYDDISNNKPFFSSKYSNIINNSIKGQYNKICNKREYLNILYQDWGHFTMGTYINYMYHLSKKDILEVLEDNSVVYTHNRTLYAPFLYLPDHTIFSFKDFRGISLCPFSAFTPESMGY